MNRKIKYNIDKILFVFLNEPEKIEKYEYKIPSSNPIIRYFSGIYEEGYYHKSYSGRFITFGAEGTWMHESDELFLDHERLYIDHEKKVIMRKANIMFVFDDTHHELKFFNDYRDAERVFKNVTNSQKFSDLNFE